MTSRSCKYSIISNSLEEERSTVFRAVGRGQRRFVKTRFERLVGRWFTIGTKRRRFDLAGTNERSSLRLARRCLAFRAESRFSLRVFGYSEILETRNVIRRRKEKVIE